MKTKRALALKDLIYNWGGYDFGSRKITVFDTTLRDGLQSPNIKRQPPLSEKITFLESCCQVGIEAIELGFPSASASHQKEIISLAKHAKKNKLKILLSCLVRTTPTDVEAIIDASQKAGVAITANFLIGSSKIRRLVEDWDLRQMKKWITQSIKTAQKYNLPTEFVTEDTTRSNPKTLKSLYRTAIGHDVQKIWIADTVGQATPNSAKKITTFFVKEIISKTKVGLDWHGHDDKGLGMANSLAAAGAGADRIQATALGTGERAGNTPMEPVIINLNLAGAANYNLKKLSQYSQLASKMFRVPIRDNYPGIGRLVHSTAAGMHAAAIFKAKELKRKDLEGVVYSPFHPEIFGRKLQVFIGPMSGGANVEWNLKRLRIKSNKKMIKKILSTAKKKNRFLSNEEIKKIAKKMG